MTCIPTTSRPSTRSVSGYQDLTGLDVIGVQHHHAHIASCLADNGETGPVIGVAFDGTGYGPDGTIWGGEFLLADLVSFERAAHLAPVPMPGGAAAIRQPWRMAASYLAAAGPVPDGLDVMTRNQQSWAAVLTMARRGINAPATSSAGRLFDAVAAVLGVRDAHRSEGQAALELEQLADTTVVDWLIPGAWWTSRDHVAESWVMDLVRAAIADDLWLPGLPARSSRPGSTTAWRRPSAASVPSCGTGPAWARSRCPAACSRTCF